MRPVAASGTAAAGGPGDRHIDHIHMNIGIGMAAVSVGTRFGVGFRFLQILFLNDLLALDHAASAVGTVVFAFFTAGTATGAELIVLDFRAGDLFAVFSVAAGTAKAKPVGDPVYESDKSHDRQHKENKQHDQSADSGSKPIVIIIIIVICITVIIVSIFVPVIILTVNGLSVRRKTKGIIGIGHGQ